MGRRRGPTLSGFILQVIQVIAGIVFLIMAVQRACSEILSSGANGIEGIVVIAMLLLLGIGLIYIRPKNISPRNNRVQRGFDLYTMLTQIIMDLNGTNQEDMEKERAQRQIEREKRLAKAKGIEIKETEEVEVEEKPAQKVEERPAQKVEEKPARRVAVACPRCGASNMALKGDAVWCEYCNSAINS